MAAIDNLLTALSERQITRQVALGHDEARMNYHLHSNIVANFDEFGDILADYYNQHFTRCVSGGGSLSSAEAAGRAKELLEREYRRRNNGDIVTAFNDAHDGTNGGMRVVLDKLAEAIKAESVERCKRRSKILALGGRRNFVALLAINSVKLVEFSLSTNFYGGSRSVYGHESMDTNSTSGFSRRPFQAEGLPAIQHQLGYSAANIRTFFTAGLSADGSN